MHLTLGSRYLNSSDGSIYIRGRRQIILEWGQVPPTLLLTMDLYRSGGGHIARLRRNQWTFNDSDRFDFESKADGFKLVDTRSGQMILQARIDGAESVTIIQGVFCNATGERIDIIMEGPVRGDEFTGFRETVGDEKMSDAMTDAGERVFYCDGRTWTVVRQLMAQSGQTGLCFQQGGQARFVSFTRGALPDDRELRRMSEEVLCVLLRRAVAR
jgi:hypothetical protein